MNSNITQKSIHYSVKLAVYEQYHSLHFQQISTPAIFIFIFKNVRALPQRQIATTVFDLSICLPSFNSSQTADTCKREKQLGCLLPKYADSMLN